MIRNAITAYTLPAAGFVGTIAFVQITFFFAFHQVPCSRPVFVKLAEIRIARGAIPTTTTSVTS